MSQNIGTLITSPIRPNDSLDPIAVAFTNEAKGGHHVYATITDRNSIISARRDWGMLATVYNDATASNNKTYQLSFSYSSNNILDNNNWIAFSSGAVTTGGEWINSVITKTSSIPLLNNDKDRYLIIGTPSGSQSVTPNTSWSGYVDAVAEWSSVISSWNFTFPTEGSTLRVDDDINTLYKYTGIYGSGGSWVVENINQVFFITATSSDGYDYTAYANIKSYSKPAVFYASFATASVGPSASLKINNLAKVPIRKVTGNALDNIGAGDLNTTVEYQLIYDGTVFQTPILSAVNQIGPAENGSTTYTNGLYTDFTSTTQIGTPVDRFNQILLALVPPNAPLLSSNNIIAATWAFGKLSFPGNTNLPNFFNFNPATGSPYGNVGIGGTWSSGATADGGYYRLGIFSGTTSISKFNINISGKLNYNVATNSATPYPAYNSSTIGDANIGIIYMYINGLTVSAVSLTQSYGATDSTLGLSKPGLSMSAATASKFPGGLPFNTFYNRTVNWYIPSTSLLGPYSYTSSIGLTANQYGITRGYNYVTINHRKNTDNYVARVEFVVDDDNTPTSVSLASGIQSLTGNKYISGIQYYTNMLVAYTVNISNAYLNTYSNSPTAIILRDGTPLTGVTASSSAGSFFNDYSTPIPDYTTSTTEPISITNNFSVNTFKRRIGDPVILYTYQVLRPLQSGTTFSSTTGAPATITNIVFDNYTYQTSGTNDTTETFYDDGYYSTTMYRLVPSGAPFDLVNIAVTGNLWDSTKSLVSDYNTSLQIYNGSLRYPTIDFSVISTSLTNNLNYGISTRNYASLSSTGIKYYYRYFKITSAAKFRITIQGSGTIISESTSFTSGSTQIKLSIKLPGRSSTTAPTSKLTGWLDCTQAFSSGNNVYTDGVGCLNAGSATFGTTGFELNTQFSTYTGGTSYIPNTVNNDGYVLVRIAAANNWIGNITSLTLVSA